MYYRNQGPIYSWFCRTESGSCYSRLDHQLSRLITTSGEVLIPGGHHTGLKTGVWCLRTVSLLNYPHDCYVGLVPSSVSESVFPSTRLYCRSLSQMVTLSLPILSLLILHVICINLCPPPPPPPLFVSHYPSVALFILLPFSRISLFFCLHIFSQLPCSTFLRFPFSFP